MSDCPNCGDDIRADGHPVMARESTGFGLANEVVTWFCSVWCREADAGVPVAYRCRRQSRLDQFGGDDDEDGGRPIGATAETSSGSEAQA